jgi:nucleoid-associated protein YgaU
VVIQAKNLTPTKPVPSSYRIKKGDTLVKIAVYFYGDGSKWRNIAKLNHIHDPNHLKVGRVIKLPKQ